VKAYAPEPVVVGRAGAVAALFGPLPDSTASEAELLTFVNGLVAHGQIEQDRKEAPKERGTPSAHRNAETHAVLSQAGERVLERRRFACGCNARGALPIIR
jgi:hypothetical protein